LAEYLDVPEISLTVNGHMALELAIQSFDFPEGAEVITTPFTFISTTHAIVRNKLQPVFCDVKEDDGTKELARLLGGDEVTEASLQNAREMRQLAEETKRG
jgi:dTDP-4-amino-4,6-dideoxygalactose transaminase